MYLFFYEMKYSEILQNILANLKKKKKKYKEKNIKQCSALLHFNLYRVFLKS